MKKKLLSLIIKALPQVMKAVKLTNTSFREHVQQRDAVIQVRLKDNSVAHHFIFQNGHISSGRGLHASPDVDVAFLNASVALKFLKPVPDQADIIHFVKNYQVEMSGDDAATVWFATLVKKINSGMWKQGTKMPDGSTRFVTNTNGGPLFVYVKDDKILRTTPIDLTDDDPESWVIKARDTQFSPKRQMTVNPHALSLKSVVYSERRVKYPMKRVDFDPKGNRNTQNRGKSGYVRISWDEALDIVADQVRRQKTTYGPGSIAVTHGAHHQMGNVGYWLSALMRFTNILGATLMKFSPISWEGWYWGAQHHYGNSLRLGLPGPYGTMEDCLKECEMIVFWSSDPEATAGLYGGGEGSQRRQWAKDLGIKFVHIDPHYNSTAQAFGGKWLPVKPTTDSALAHAIMYVWITENLYDKTFIANCTTGFEEWKEYILGREDGTPKTPAWQESETGIPAKDVTSLARMWASKKTYLSAGGLGTGFGGACRAATGQQWARNMILLMTMQGWGKPGVNFGNLQCGAPVDLAHYFPGYAEGGISGDLTRTASSINNYVRMPHVVTVNPVEQRVPREYISEAIKTGKAEAYLWDGMSLEAQFRKAPYPSPGNAEIHMIYQYGGSSFGTTMNSSRRIEMYRDEKVEFVVSQSIWNEGEAQFADIILPACTVAERADISEVSGCAAFGHHNQTQMNHRMVVMQHECIKPLWESKSDYRIFTEVLGRLGFGPMYSEGCSELDWCKRIFDSTDAVNFTSWSKFLKKGYVVFPPQAEDMRDNVYMRWMHEGRKKDVPEPHPLPGDYSGDFLDGLQTQSGKIEFLPNSLKRGDPDNEERPVLNRYKPAWEGPASGEQVKAYPLQLVTGHPRYSFHTHMDGKNSHINDIQDHRIKIDGYAYWIVRMNSIDAADRCLNHHSLVKVYNDRAGVICALDVSPLVARGTLKTYESSAEFDFIQDENGKVLDRGGCMNLLTPSRTQAKGTTAIAPNSCLVEVEQWNNSWEVRDEKMALGS
ncbi:molybdopterin-dependent oxidoreductase [Kordiimonas pumila]|uniref:Molybdopterin-dependent oxidoreductase n=1 Tax=Kordiimonas pumila TaxID=2161677 RepID=A0ABV7D7B0_9PROT|nr:molybdopterin-dependent oxidoreductase [Kordiimonas pumila]